MGNPKPLPVYWDKILITASQVTNPPIDPLREPMETKVFLGKKPEKVERGADGKLICKLPPQLELSMPMMFSALELHRRGGLLLPECMQCLLRQKPFGLCQPTLRVELLRFRFCERF